MYYIAGDMQQLHERGEGSPPYALRASAAEEDPHNGEQPQRFHQVSVSSVLEWAYIQSVTIRVQRDQENIVVVKQMPRVKD